MRHRRAKSFHLLLSALAGIATMWMAQAQEAGPIAVEAIAARSRPIVESIPVNGTLTPPRLALISTEVAGLVSKVHADLGHRIRSGEPLLELDRELNSIARDAALADVERRRTLLADARRRLGEAQALLGDNYIAESDVETLTSQAQVAQAELRAAEIEARRQTALLRRHQVNAPFTGIVSRKLAEVGEWVEPGTELFEVVSTEHLYADLQVPQRYYARIGEQTPLRLAFDTGDDRTYRATMLRKVPLSGSGARTFVLRTEIVDEGQPALIPGMSVSAQLRLGTERQAVAIPRDALTRYPDGRITVWVATDFGGWDKPASVTEKLVTTGLGFDGLVEIRSGLSPGQVVITRGNESLQEGQRVLVRQAATAGDG
ncbi:efflux RND transporter periplasmic adaptor subunit [Microbulbifer yueqingensis]|uniref:RND family efflux transporter, MFP subunit n=1 Tax=Microbulbifer yueqingensis TaxID=658219 RepID=A0A1G8Z7C3_9GAMM|nr:efflux RND transporter periplasmic adaptor subunit [Microbulbifer yueqingensis]SDK10989.1 RND family efflux transporter, MFP subunit [Microbulbifer yueqingensis]